MSYYLLTGSTGFLGKKIARQLILDGHKIIMVGKSKNGIPFEQRAKGLFADLATGSQIATIEFDLENEPSEKLINETRKITDILIGIWHFAANLSFKEKDRDTVFKTNVEGTQLIIDLALNYETVLYHTSTAYVHGRSSGISKEIVSDSKPKFNNPYEESKYVAERKVVSHKELKYVIFRPSIIYDEKGSEITNFGYYSFLIGLYKFRKSLPLKFDRKIYLPIPFLCKRKAKLNLIPLGHTVEWMLEISRKQNCDGLIFNICNPSPESLSLIFKETFEASRLVLPVFEVPRFFAKLYLNTFIMLGSMIHSLKPISRRIMYFKYYLLDHAGYDFKNTANKLGVEFVERVAQKEKRHIYSLAQKVLLNLENK